MWRNRFVCWEGLGVWKMSGSSRKCQGREGRVARGKSGIGSKTKNWFAVSTYIHSTVTAAVAILDRVISLLDPFSMTIFV